MEKFRGLKLKKGDIVRYNGNLYEVKEDNEWNKLLDCWGSVWLVNFYPSVFTHKGGIELVSRKNESSK